MKKIIKNWRYWLLCLIAVAANLNLVAVPAKNSDAFYAIMLYSKFTAVCLFYFDYKLYRWFEKRHEIDDIVEYLNKEE